MNIMPDFPDQPALTAPRPEPRKPRRLRKFLLTAGGLFLLLLLSLLLTALFFPVDTLKGYLIRAVEDQTGFRCTIDKLTSDAIGGNFSMRGLTLTDPARDLPTPLLHIEEASLRIALSSLPGILTGRPATIEEIRIAKGSFNTAIFEQSPTARAKPAASPQPDSAPAATGTSATAPRPSPAPVTSRPLILVKNIDLQNIGIFGRESAKDSPPLRVGTGRIRHEKAHTYAFALQASGKDQDEMVLQGQIRNLHFPSFHEAQVMCRTTCTRIRQQNIFELLGLPASKQNVVLAPASGELELEYADETTRLHGDLTIPTLKIGASPEFRNARLTFDVSYDQEQEHFIFSDIRAQSQSGANLAGSGELTRKGGGWEFTTDLRESALPAPLLFGIIGKPEYNHAVSGLLHLTGRLENRGGWSFRGAARAEELALAHLSASQSGTLSAQVDCSEQKRLLELTDLHLTLDTLQAAGTAVLPLGKSPDQENLRLELQGNLDCAKLKFLPAVITRAEGHLRWTLHGAGKSGGTLDIQTTVQSTAGQPLVLHLEHARRSLEAGEISLSAQTEISLSDGALTVQRLKLKAIPAEVQIVRHQDNSRTQRYEYVIDLFPRALLPLLEEYRPDLHSACAGIERLNSSGRAERSGETRVLSLPSFQLTAFLNSAAKAQLRGDLRLQENDLALSGTGLSLKLLNNAGKEELSAEGQFSCAPPSAAGDPDDELQVKMRGDIGEALRILNESNMLNELAGISAQAALNLRLRNSRGVVALAAAANIARLECARAGLPDWRVGALTLSTEATYSPAQQQLDVKSMRANLDQGKLTTTASGTLNFKDGLSGRFSLSGDTDLGTILLTLGSPAPAPAGGRLSFLLNLAGTPENPELVFSANAPNIVLGRTAPLYRLNAPALSGRTSWRTTPQGIRDIVLAELLVRGESESFLARGRAETIRLNDNGDLDFGKGAVCNFRLQSVRSLLAFLFPRTNLLVKDPGKPDSLTFSGLAATRSFPLRTPWMDPQGNLQLPPGILLRNSIIRLDELRTDYIALKEISAVPSLENGILRIDKGSGDLGGPVQFGLTMDFNRKPVSARATTSGMNLSVPGCLSGLKIRTRFEQGQLSFPWPLSQQQIVATWQGLDMPSLQKTLAVEDTGLHIENLQLTTMLKMPDFYKMFSYDLPPDLAREAAKRMEERFAARYAKPITPIYKSVDLNFNVRDGVLTVTRCFIGGGNTADFELGGKLYLNGDLDMYLRPVKNMANTFDAGALAEEPSLRQVIAKLPPAQQEKAKGILPGWLEEAANKRKLSIHIINNVDDPTIDPAEVRNRIKAELPYILQKITGLLEDKDLMNGLIGEEGVKVLEELKK